MAPWRKFDFFERRFCDFLAILRISVKARIALFCVATTFLLPQRRVNLRILTRRFFRQGKITVFEFWFYRKFTHLRLFLRLYCLNFLCVISGPFLPSWILSLMRVRLSQTSPTRSFVPVQIYAVSHRAIDLNRRKFVFKRRYAKTSLRIFCNKLTDLPQTAV